MEGSSSPKGFSGLPAAVASRGRGRGRPPKLASAATPTAAALDGNPPAAASPTPPLDADTDSSQNECRRSSRKKIIKFDVRDLLNKNRKAHKIQIEARIDSNPNGNASNPSSSPAPPGSAPAGNSNNNRLFSMFESGHQALPPPPPPPHALEIFAKPRPTQSLIVAQVSSEPSTSPVQTLAAMPVVAVRKRGRPRKSAPPIAVEAAPAPSSSIAPSCSDSDTNSNSTSTSLSTGSGSGSGGDSVEAAAGGVVVKRKSKLRVSLKRLNLSRRQESSDSGDTPLNITVVGPCNSPPSSSSSVGDPLVLQDENALDEKPEPQQQPVKELATILVPGDNSDSDSQIIFIEIETSETGKEDEQEQEQEQEQEPELLPPEIEIDLEKPEPEPDLEEIMVEVLSEPPSLWSADDEEEEDGASQPATAESSSPAPRRSRRSVQPRGGSRQGKTLEETFAEIAAESSKQILESSEESQGHEQQEEEEEEQHVLIDLIEDSQEIKELTPADNVAAEEVVVAQETEVISKKEEESVLEVELKAEEVKLEEVKLEEVKLEEKSEEITQHSNEEACGESKVKADAIPMQELVATTVLKPEETVLSLVAQPKVSPKEEIKINEDPTKSLPETNSEVPEEHVQPEEESKQPEKESKQPEEESKQPKEESVQSEKESAHPKEPEKESVVPEEQSVHSKEPVEPKKASLEPEEEHVKPKNASVGLEKESLVPEEPMKPEKTSLEPSKKSGEPEQEALPKLQAPPTEAKDLPPPESLISEELEPIAQESQTIQQKVTENKQTEGVVVVATVTDKPESKSALPSTESDTPVETDKQPELTSFDSNNSPRKQLPIAAPDETKIIASEQSEVSKASSMDKKKSKKEHQAKKPSGSDKKEVKKEPKKSSPESLSKKEKETDKREKLPEKISPARELVVAKKDKVTEAKSEKSPPEQASSKQKEPEQTSLKQKEPAETLLKQKEPAETPLKQKDPAKPLKGSKKESEREKSSPENAAPKKKEHRQSPSEMLPKKEKDSRKSPTEHDKKEPSKSQASREATPPDTLKTAATDPPKKPTTDSASKSKDKSAPGFIECDAMFKAMDKANAQMRLEEKTKKKVKKVVQPKMESPPPVAASTPALPKKSSLGRKAGCRRNTVYEDSPKLERSSSPGSDSTRVSTPVGKTKRAKARNKFNPRRSTISEEAHIREKNLSASESRMATISPVSSSSDSSSKRSNNSKKGNASKLELRRNTICEERQAETSPAIPLSKRRYSLHPKASADLLPEMNRSAAKKRARKAAKQLLSRQDSMDSSSSASQGRGNKRKARKSAEALHADLLETESSESTSSGSKMQRSSSGGTASPELETSDTLKDIAKFIEDGVNLLKRDYKVGADEEVKQEPQAEEDEFAQRVANLETPGETPSPSPEDPSASASTTNSLQESSGVRRSHRIKQKPQGPKASQGRGVTSMALAPISMDEQLAELAHIEAINEAFLRSEGLNTFQALRENYYRCARQVSQENAEMQCDCFLTGDEEAQGHLCCGAGCINRMLMIECGPLCTNRDRCTNKRFQQHKCWPCRVFRTEKKGCGITAELQIPPGEFIMEYVGEVIDSEEFERRQHLYSRDRKRHYYFMALRGEAIIDATSKGNISRFINHSCDPNAETQKWTVNGELRIGFFSVKPIQPGEEITFDYQYQRYGKDAQRCYCEATNCRGWIGGEPDSDEGEQLDVESDSEAELEEEELEPEADQEAAGEEAGVSRKLTKVKTPSKIKIKLPTAASRKRKEQQVKAKDREYKAGRWLKPSAIGSGEKPARKPKVSKFHAMLEDPDVLEELSLLSRSGLKNQLDTLRFSRCMVRAKLLQTRLQLLVVLTRGELPCRRLFLDYHGLRLLHGWINENGNDIQLRVALLEAFESLPIPNRTMLNESRVYQSVEQWSSSLEPGQSQEEMDSSALHKRMVALLQKWQALPEIFRIPKRERIEQMKEHEREADGQQKHVLQHASTALEDQRERESTSDRYRQDRFRRDTTSSRISSKPIRMSGNNTICTITTQPKGGSNGSMDGGMARNDNRRRSDIGPATEPRRTLSKELRRSLFERKVALDEAEKRVCSEDWREHELRCEFFGADLKTDPKQLPFYQNTETGEWFNSEDQPVATPQRTDLQTQAMHSPEETNPGPSAAPAVEYKLPAGVDPLPPAWTWRMTADGDIYYYNLRERVSQWEPPSAEQRLQTLVEEDATQQPLHELQNDPELLAKELIQVDTDYVGSLSAKSLAQYVEGKVKERRELRRNRLVSVRVISPRRDEDRLYNQLESRKYKENKEKIRRRKEIYRRRRPEAIAAAAAIAATLATDKPEDGSAAKSLPIQGYLYSSDEEAGEATAAAAAAAEPLADGLVAKAKKVDELDALNMAPSTSSAAAALAAMVKEAQASGSSSSKRKLPMPPQVPEAKKQRADKRAQKNKNVAAAPPVNMREAHEKFRFEVSGLVAEILRPYRKESCRVGRICSDEDYKFLIKRLSQHITAKEMRYCDAFGQPLLCTESVRHKSYDFIHQYMRKKGRLYRKPAESAGI